MLSLIYSASIIDVAEYHRNCSLMWYKTSNNQQILDSMEFYVFNNSLKYFEDILEKENENNSNSGNTDQKAEDTMKNAKQMMRQQQASFKHLSAPKIKL